MDEVGISKAWLAEVVELAADAIICVDEDQNVLFFNHGAEEIFGYTSEEMIGKPLSILLPERFRTAHAQLVREFGSSSVTVRPRQERSVVGGLRKDGEEFPAEASIAKTMVGERQVYSVVLRDVTARTRAQEALERKGSAIRELYRIGSDPALALEGKINAYLELGCQVFGLEQAILSRVVGDQYEILHAYPESDAVHRGIVLPLGHTCCELTLRASAPVGFARVEGSEWEMHSCYGLSRLEAYLGSPVLIGEEVVGTLSFSSLNPRERPISDGERDLIRLMALWIGNELHRQEHLDSIKDAVLRRNDLLAFVAHDLRNPLSAISMSVQHLLDSPLDDERGGKIHGRLEGVLSAANRMETLIQDLLDLQLLEEGRLRIWPTDIPAADLLAEAISGFEVQIEEEALDLESDVEEGLIVRADRNRVLRLLTNLLDNALKFTDEGGRISLKAEKHEEDVLFSVSDTGVGIAEERLPTLFDRFARADDQKGGGAGLGLDIAREIVEAHDGAMWVESKLGAGTTFYFTLPGTRAD
jgi:PAS domain S-box-containing protein